MRLPAGKRSRNDEPTSAADEATTPPPDGAAEAVPAAGSDTSRSEPPRETRRARRSRAASGTRSGLQQFLTVFYRVCRVVFLLLALAVALGIVFVLAPTNDDNSVVELVNDVADGAAGPFRDVFTVDDDRDREIVVNYGFAAFVYLLAAALVTRLPGGKR